jgi:hypothetical protein
LGRRSGATTLACLVGLGFAGAQGCGDTIDSRGQSEPTELPTEAIGEAKQAAGTTANLCLSVRTGTTQNGIVFKSEDTAIGEEKGNNNTAAR